MKIYKEDEDNIRVLTEKIEALREELHSLTEDTLDGFNCEVQKLNLELDALLIRFMKLKRKDIIIS